MSFQSFLTKIFGNKSTRDLKEIEPIVKKIEALEPEVKQLTIDQLRERIDNVRADISQAISAEKEENERLRVEVEELPFDQRQPVWDKIDRNEKTMLDTIEDKLNEHLPEVFAVVRETAARFAANETIVVKATQLDRELAAQ
ncbi:MAG: preprotein translocase subunit SecA, partial [Duncaniella dubosii]|nr:preprotein translocase subunit SecA [Duncaniella dubosii]